LLSSAPICGRAFSAISACWAGVRYSNTDAWVRMFAWLITSQICSGVNSSSSASATVAGCSSSQNARSPAAFPSASISVISGLNSG
jgi:hypothetical protein